MMIINTDRRQFRSQTSDVWTDAATVVGRVREERVSRKKIKVREKSRKIVFFPPLCGPRRSGGCRAMRRDERSKVARGCGAKRAKHAPKSKC